MPDAVDQLKTALADRYTIERELGAGGMATVYLAEDLKHRRKVAIKVLRPELAAAIGQERFLREIEIAANLTHPHILPLFDSGRTGRADRRAGGQAVGRSDEFLYYVMPYVEGETLRDRLDRETQLPLDDALQITREVANALTSAHKHGVIHRDIKPENILFAEGHAILADFGIARAVAEAGGDQLTETGLTVGTPAYMSPEQASGEQGIDCRSDIYSLGCVLYEMLVGEPPFTGPTPVAITARKLSESVPRIAVVRDVPEHVEQVVHRALSRIPADRFATAQQFADELSLDGQGTGAISTSAERPAARRPAVAVAMAVAVVVIAAGLVLWLMPSDAPTAAQELPTLAVLPFDNLGSADDDYFAAGITEEITSRIAEISGLRVISRQSAMQYQDSEKSLQQIGEELGVEYVLEGTIRTDRSPDGGQMRVTPQLIDVSDDTHLWTDRYTVTLVPGEIFGVQEQVAEEVARALDVTLLEPERRRLAASPTDNLEAYEFYLRGNDYSSRGFEGQEARIAVDMYQKAVELDPDFASAYAKLSWTHSRMWFLFTDRTDARLVKAKQAVDRALALAPDLADAHAALGFYYYRGFLDYERALEAFSMAQDGQPNNSDVLMGIAFIRRRQGNMEEALVNLLRAAELEPRSAVIPLHIAETYTLTRNTARAEIYFDRAISLRPDWGVPYYAKARRAHLRNQGNIERARATLEFAQNTGIVEARIDHLWVELLMMERDYQEALTQMVRLPRRPPDQFQFVPVAQLYADIHGLLGNQELARMYYDSARTEVKALIQDDPNDARYHSALGIAYAGLGRAEDAVVEGELAVQMLPVSKEAWRGMYRVVDLARVYTMVGRYDQAIDRLEFVLSNASDISAPMLAIDPKWDSLREHPGFRRLVENVSR